MKNKGPIFTEKNTVYIQKGFTVAVYGNIGEFFASAKDINPEISDAIRDSNRYYAQTVVKSSVTKSCYAIRD